jgi:DNA-binding GntR family transcriptional regulator
MVGMDLVLICKGKQPTDKTVDLYCYPKNIIDLHLKPGQTVSEAELAVALNMSRTPVREAFIRLSEEGIMEIHPQRGSVISLIDLDQAQEAHFVRRVLEKAIMGEACTFFPEASLIDLRANTEMQRRCNGEKNHHRMLELDNAFHEIIYSGCNKSRTWLQLKKNAYNLDRLRMLYLSSNFSWDELIDEHNQLIDLIADKNTKKVNGLVESHLRKKRYEEIGTQISQYVKKG